MSVKKGNLIIESVVYILLATIVLQLVYYQVVNHAAFVKRFTTIITNKQQAMNALELLIKDIQCAEPTTFVIDNKKFSCVVSRLAITWQLREMKLYRKEGSDAKNCIASSITDFKVTFNKYTQELTVVIKTPQEYIVTVKPLNGVYEYT